MEEDKYIKRQKVYKIIMLIVLTAFITFLVTSTYILNHIEDKYSFNLQNIF